MRVMYKNKTLVAKIIQNFYRKTHFLKSTFTYRRHHLFKKCVYLVFLRLLLRPSPISFAKAERAFA
ncbi:hypothetical protein GGR09_000165 [Bartonella heixiaziensis]